MSALYPLKFRPVYKDYLWGNTRLPQLYKRQAPEGVYAESWEISSHQDGVNIIENGAHAGEFFTQVVEQHGKNLLGHNVEGDDFPLLIKLIDAAQPLSVQVHPNNANADSVQGEPKTEMWYFLDADDEAKVYCGLNEDTSRGDFVRAIENNSFKTILQQVPARQGEAVYVPGGRVHAIDSGCLILEIQQNSNTTYRVHDWDRRDAAGNARELHIDKALQVINFDEKAEPLTTPKAFLEGHLTGTEICVSPFFKLDRFDISEASTIVPNGDSFHALFVSKGTLTIKWEGGQDSAPAGTSLLVPAAMGQYELIPETSEVTLLRTTVPPKQNESLL